MMDKNEIFTKISAIVKEIHDQHSYLSSHPEKLNELELELFLANSKFLTGHIEIFQKINNASSPEHRVHTPSQVLPDPTIREEPKPTYLPNESEKAESEKITTFYLDAEPIEDIETEETYHDLSGIYPDKNTEEGLVGASEEEEANIQQLDAPEEHIPTVNELISSQLNHTTTLAGQFNSQPVKDLKSLINLNDKLLFIKDLFNGYSLAYSEAIELVNRFSNFEAADKFLKSNYAAKNNWDDKQNTVSKLYELLKRRYT